MMTKFERTCAGCALLFVLAVVLWFCSLVCGCQSTFKGGNIHDGVNASVGVKLPSASAASYTLQLLWLLNGWVFSWEEDSLVYLDRTSVTHTKFAGIYESSATNRTSVLLFPNGTNAVGKCHCATSCACKEPCPCAD